MVQGFSAKSIEHNIQELIRQGKSPKQAKAIAEAMARKAKRQQMADGGEAQPPLKANLLGLAMQRAGVKGFDDGGYTDDVSGNQNVGNKEYVFNFGQRAMDPIGLFKQNQGNTFQASAPGGEGWTGEQSRTEDLMAQQMAAQRQGQEVYAQQGQLANQLAETASGRGPSMADMQNQQATQRNIAGAASLAASARGVNPALAARMAGEQATNANQQAAGQSAMARLAEQRSAQEQLANVYGQQQQAALARQQMWGQQGTTERGQTLQAQMEAQKINSDTAAGNVAASRGLLGSIFGGIGSAMAEGGNVERFDDGGLAGAEAGADAAMLSGPDAGALGGAEQGNSSMGMVGLRDDLNHPEAPPDEIAPQMDTSLGALGEMKEPAPAGLTAEQTDPVRDPIKGAGPTAPPSSKSSSIWPTLIKYLMGAMLLKSNQKTTIPRRFEEGGRVDAFAYGGEEAIEQQNDAAQNTALKAISSAGPWGAAIAGILGMADAHNDGKFAAGGPGGSVPGVPPVPGPNDTAKNDVVPALLSPGEIVLPRSVTKSSHPEERAAGFVLGVKSTRAHPLPSNPTPEDMARLEERMLNPEAHAEGGVIERMQQPSPETQRAMAEWHQANSALSRAYQEQEAAQARRLGSAAQTGDGSALRQMKADLIADERHAQMQQANDLKTKLFAHAMAAALRDSNAAQSNAKDQPSRENLATAAAAKKAVEVMHPALASRDMRQWKDDMVADEALQRRAEGGEIGSGDDLMAALPKRRPSLRKALMFPNGGNLSEDLKGEALLEALSQRDWDENRVRNITDEDSRKESDEYNDAVMLQAMATADEKSAPFILGDIPRITDPKLRASILESIRPILEMHEANRPRFAEGGNADDDLAWAEALDRKQRPGANEREGLDFLARQMVEDEGGQFASDAKREYAAKKAGASELVRDDSPIQLHPMRTKGEREGLDFLSSVMAEEEANKPPMTLTPRGQGPIQLHATKAPSDKLPMPPPEPEVNDAITIAVNTPGTPPPPPAGAAPAGVPGAMPGAPGVGGGAASISVGSKVKGPGGGAPSLEAPLSEQSPEKAYHDANKDWVAAIQSNADVEGKKLLMQAAALEKGEAERRIRQQEFDAAQKVRQQQLEDLASDIRNTKVDAANLWNNKSTGQKVMASIGIMFGAMSQGLQGLKTNPVLDLIQKQIDNDIEAQKSNLHNKHSLFKDYLDLTGSEVAAEQYARSDLLASTAAQMQLISLKMGNEQAQVGAQYAIAELQKAQQSADAAAANALVEQRIKILKAASEANLRDAQARHLASQTAQGWASLGIKAQAQAAKAKGAGASTIGVPTEQEVINPRTGKPVLGPDGQPKTEVQYVPYALRNKSASAKIGDRLTSIGTATSAVKELEDIFRKHPRGIAVATSGEDFEDMSRATTAIGLLENSFEPAISGSARMNQKIMEVIKDIAKDPTKFWQTQGTVRGSLNLLKKDLAKARQDVIGIHTTGVPISKEMDTGDTSSGSSAGEPEAEE